MAKFSDGKTTWILTVDVNAVRRVRDAKGHNLAGLFDNNLALIDTLTDDVVELVDVLYLVCEPQATADGINAIQFGEGLTPETIEEGFQALLDAAIDFFPKSRQAAARRILETIRTASKQLDLAAAARLDLAIEEIETGDVIEKAIAKLIDPPINSTETPSSDYATNSPELLESSPADSVSPGSSP